MSSFVPRLKELLASCEKSQSAISRELGVSKQKLSKWKTGYNEPSIDEIVTLARYFSVSCDYLLGADDDARPASEV